jgi:CRISPR-associated protein Csm3
MKLLGYKTIEGKIMVKTGLHIGGSSNIIEIGGMDNPVIKNPLTNEPYIPGSSLKGKMRSLTEWKTNKVDAKGDVHTCKNADCIVCRLFGTTAKDFTAGPTRVIVRDAELTQEWKDKIYQEGKTLVEEKYENALNRITAVANPRPMERVCAGVEFKFEINYRIFDINNDNGNTDKEYFKYLLDALRYVQNDALGGCGSRGCGQIEFKDIMITDIDGSKETMAVLV